MMLPSERKDVEKEMKLKQLESELLLVYEENKLLKSKVLIDLFVERQI